MIARVRGRPVANTPDGLVVDVGGVGYLVAATPSAVRKADGAAEVSLHTYLHVREDALQLYGFAEAAERELFVQLLSVNGVGPKVALAIVSGSPAAELRRAIVLEDTARFQAIPGIGKKTAERLVLELRDKLPKAVPGARGDASAASADVVNALLGLGYNEREAQAAVKQLPPDLQLADAIRQALKNLAKT
jgi:Holliday junction DNA helicase RuvA